MTPEQFAVCNPEPARPAPAPQPPAGRCRVALLAALIGALLLALLALAGQAPVHAQLPEVTLLSPADGSSTTVETNPPLAVPDFVWERVPSATKYRIQFSQDSGFATIALEVTTENPRYTPTSVTKFSDGTRYWRVRVEAPSPPGSYSDVWSFTKQWAGPGNAPLLQAPADGQTLAFYQRPAFSWRPVPGAARYRLQIASSPDGFNAPLLDQSTLAPAVQPANKLANGAYYWRVLPVDPSDHAGAPSEVRSFTVDYGQAPAPLAPADGAQPAFTPSFEWTAMRGAEYYRLEYSTDPAFQSGVTAIESRNTAYTPLDALPNDVNYYWRVRAHSGSSVSAWSPTRQFVKKWTVPPALLTPVKLAQGVQTPLFSWTPVPGASRYKVEVSPSNTFPPATGGFTEITANTTLVKPGHDWNRSSTPPWTWTWYWRVTALDHKGNAGLPSQAWSFDYDAAALAPPLIYPPFYYHSAGMLPGEERAVAVPAFLWQRVLTSTLLPGALLPNAQVAAYRIQVDGDPLFGSPDWTWDTENLSAAPSAEAPFTPTRGVDYYWRVRPLDGLGGNEIGGWSQRWITRVDAALGPAPTTGPAPQLLRPEPGAEAVETTPMLEWWPLLGADSYDLQISASGDPFEAYITHTATALYPAYTPPLRLGPGTYYWRVRGRSGGLPLGEWSDPWRFQVAAQSRWRAGRDLGNPENRLAIGADPAGDMGDPNYDLTALYAAQSSGYWFFGLAVVTGTVDMAYALYLDLDHADGSGATADPRGYQVQTIAAHRPEYAIYLLRAGGELSAGNTIVYGWTGSDWGIPDTLAGIGGALYDAGDYVEIQVPNTAIGMEEETGSAAVALWSALAGGGHAQDTAPSDPNVAYPAPDPGPETTTLSRFSSVSDRLTPALPPNNATGDPALWPSLPPFAWHLPVDTPWVGYGIQAALDAGFTTLKLNEEKKTSYGDAFVPPLYTHFEDLEGDNAYFWRVRPVHTAAPLRGAWSQAARFERKGFTVQDLKTSVTFATPTFSWARMEGAETYDLQVDNDPNFASPEVSANNTGQNSYTPLTTLEKGAYYWRVRADRYNGVTNDWSQAVAFTLDLPRPAGLESDPPGVVERAPTLCWTPVVTPTDGPAVLAAWKYRVEVSKGDPNFSQVYDSAETEQACWTPVKGYSDLTDYYWHVAMRDGNSRLGSYSIAHVFSKQYPTTTLIWPVNGSPIGTSPAFQWTPVDGAASYRLEVSLYANFGTLVEWALTNNTHYTPLKAYDPLEAYYWRVAIVDKDGNYGPYSTTRTGVIRLWLPLVVRDK